MALNGIRPSPYFFLQRPGVHSWRYPRRGILPTNACFQKLKTQYSPDLHGLNCRKDEIPHSHEIVSSSSKRRLPRDSFQSAMTSLTQHANRLDPAKHLFDSLPFLLTHVVAIMARRAAINRAATLAFGVLRHMRSDIHASHLL